MASCKQANESGRHESDACGLNDVEICKKSGTADLTDNKNALIDVLPSPGRKGVSVAASMTTLEPNAKAQQNQEFSMSRQTEINCFTNQDDVAINEGYDSEGWLLYYPEDLLSKEIDKEYNESPMDNKDNNDGIGISLPQKSLTEVDIVKLGVKELKEELKKQGCPISGKKADLAACLTEATTPSLPVQQ